MDFLGLLTDAGHPTQADAVRNLIEELSEARGVQSAIRVRFARLGRLLSRDPVTAGALDEPELLEPRFSRADVLGRVAFLVEIDRRATELGIDSVEVITNLYRTGGSREQASVMRALPWLSQPERFVSLAAEAARTNDVEVFAALSMMNRFPSRYLPDLAFFQMVMKSMFLDLDATGVLGLRERITPELRRMALDFRREREAAGRVVPGGVSFIESTS